MAQRPEAEVVNKQKGKELDDRWRQSKCYLLQSFKAASFEKKNSAGAQAFTDRRWQAKKRQYNELSADAQWDSPVSPVSFFMY